MGMDLVSLICGFAVGSMVGFLSTAVWAFVGVWRDLRDDERQADEMELQLRTLRQRVVDTSLGGRYDSADHSIAGTRATSSIGPLSGHCIGISDATRRT